MTRGRYRDERERITRNVRVDAGGCWRWQLATWNGYGRVTVGGASRIAHRFSYETFVGPIPDGLTIDHLCRVRNCVNPAHLEAVTIGENVERSPHSTASVNAAKTHCPQNHPYDEVNTFVRTDRAGGGRKCRTCMRERRAARRQRAAA